MAMHSDLQNFPGETIKSVTKNLTVYHP